MKNVLVLAVILIFSQHAQTAEVAEQRLKAECAPTIEDLLGLNHEAIGARGIRSSAKRTKELTAEAVKRGMMYWYTIAFVQPEGRAKYHADLEPNFLIAGLDFNSNKILRNYKELQEFDSTIKRLENQILELEKAGSQDVKNESQVDMAELARLRTLVESKNREKADKFKADKAFKTTPEFAALNKEVFALKGQIQAMEALLPKESELEKAQKDLKATIMERQKFIVAIFKDIRQEGGGVLWRNERGDMEKIPEADIDRIYNDEALMDPDRFQYMLDSTRSEYTFIMWGYHDPKRKGIIYLNAFDPKVSNSAEKIYSYYNGAINEGYTISINQDPQACLDLLAKQERTRIHLVTGERMKVVLNRYKNEQVRKDWIEDIKAGKGYTIEVRDKFGELVGVVVGYINGSVFEPDTVGYKDAVFAKVGAVFNMEVLKAAGIYVMDSGMVTPLTDLLGADYFTKEEYDRDVRPLFNVQHKVDMNSRAGLTVPQLVEKLTSGGNHRIIKDGPEHQGQPTAEALLALENNPQASLYVEVDLKRIGDNQDQSYTDFVAHLKRKGSHDLLAPERQPSRGSVNVVGFNLNSQNVRIFLLDAARAEQVLTLEARRAGMFNEKEFNMDILKAKAAKWWERVKEKVSSKK